MRLVVMFDLPTETNEDKRQYRKFRKFLLSNGYIMMQYSVYSKILINHSVVNQQKVKLQKHLPPNGLVQVLAITEKQFSDIELLIGESKSKQQLNDVSRLVVL